MVMKDSGGSSLHWWEMKSFPRRVVTAISWATSTAGSLNE
jgi:hypothetical protein